MSQPHKISGCAVCIGIAAVLFIAWFSMIVVEQSKINREFEKKQKARHELELNYKHQLEVLSGLCDLIRPRCNPHEKVQLSNAEGYHHMGNEASEFGSDEYRKQKFDELQKSIQQLRDLADILRANPQMSPTEAKKLVKYFHCF